MNIKILVLPAIIATFGFLLVSGAPAQNVRKITGTVVQVIYPNAGPQVEINSGGQLYSFAFGTTSTRKDITLGKAWNMTLGTLKAGDSVVIDYNELNGNYGLAVGITRISSLASTRVRPVTPTKVDLANTTWNMEVYFTGSGSTYGTHAKMWEPYGRVTLMRDGTVQGYDVSSWKLAANKLTISAADSRWVVTLRGKVGTGRGTATWKDIPMLVRMYKQ